jgi:hypothetical protein
MKSDYQRIVSTFVRTLKIPDISMEEFNSAYQLHYEILLGQVNSGQKNPTVKKELKEYILRAITEGLIPKAQGYNKLFELSLYLFSRFFRCLCNIIMTKTIIINSSNYIQGSGNRYVVYTFPQTSYFPTGPGIGVSNIAIYNSVQNIAEYNKIILNWLGVDYIKYSQFQTDTAAFLISTILFKINASLIIYMCQRMMVQIMYIS